LPAPAAVQMASRHQQVSEAQGAAVGLAEAEGGLGPPTIRAVVVLLVW